MVFGKISIEFIDFLLALAVAGAFLRLEVIKRLDKYYTGNYYNSCTGSILERSDYN